MGITKFIETVCVQTAVYWANPQPDGMGGFIYDFPVEIPCRWEDRAELLTLQSAKDKKEIISRAKVLLTQDVQEQGWLQLTTLDVLDSAPIPVPGEAHEILIVERTPLFKKTNEFVIIAYL